MKRDFRGVLYFNAFVLVAITVVGVHNLLFFHTILELSTIFLGLAIYIVAVYSKEYSKSKIIIFIGVSYIFTGTLDLLHIFTNDALGVFAMSKNISTEFWMSARLTEAFVLLLAYAHVLKVKNISLKSAYAIFIAITSFMIGISVFADFIPPLYLEGTGYTTYKYMLDILVVIVFAFALFSIRKNESRAFNKRILTYAILLKIASQLSFMFVVEGESLFVIISLLTKYLSYIALFVVFGRDSLTRPYENIFHAFKEKEKKLTALSQRDSLSGLYNHSMIYEKLDELILRNDFDKSKLCLMMIDIDDFKTINDKYGHVKGDEIIISIASIFKACEGPIDLAGRYGGDEFAVAFSRCDKELAIVILKKLYSRINEISIELGVPIGLSIGVSIWESGMDSISLVKKADLLMYRSKENGKNRFTF